MGEPEQMDWLRFEDNRAQLHHLLLSSVERVGVVEVARHLGETPSALRNQVAGRRALPPGAFSICFLLDAEFRAAAVGVTGEVLSRPADLTPEEALRLLAVEAQAKGYVDRARVAELLQRMRPEDRQHLRAVGAP